MRFICYTILIGRGWYDFMVVCIILLALVLIMLLAGYLAARIALLRGDAFDPRDPNMIAKSAWAKFAPEVLAGVAWIQAQDCEPIDITSFDGLRLHARLIRAGENRATILLFHGYRSMYCIDFSCAAEYYHSLGLNLLLIDQRAHGESEGRYITYGIHERHDCLSWARACYARFGSAHKLLLGGVSMGASTVLMASDLPLPPTVCGIIADCGFSSPWDIIAHVMKSRYHLPQVPFLYLVDFYARLLARFSLREHSTRQSIAQSELPLLLLHGTADRFVPCEMTEQLYRICKDNASLVLVDGAGHGGSFLVDRARCTAALEMFLNKIL